MARRTVRFGFIESPFKKLIVAFVKLRQSDRLYYVAVIRPPPEKSVENQELRYLAENAA
jgi:hypothetical protein